MHKNLLLTTSLLALSALFHAGDARAEMMDYNALQDLFGEPVTTSATGTPQRVSEVATNMAIITQDQIRRAGTRDIPQIINIHVPGIDILQSGREGYDVGIRGYQQPNQPRLLVLIDGRQVFIDDYSRTLWTSLPVNVDDIRQIEVVKGPSSALFGSNAAGGVVNIITKNPLYDDSNVVSAGIGSGGYLSGDATATGRFGSLGGIKVSAGGMNADEFDSRRNPTEIPTRTDPMRRYVAGSGAFQLSPSVQANFEATYSESENTEAAFTHALFGQTARNASVKLGGSYLSPVGVITANTYYNHSKIGISASEFPVTFALNTDLLVAQLEDQFKIGSDHTVRIATEYRNKRFILGYNDPAFNAQNPKIAQNSYSAGGTWLWTVTDALTFTNALRLDHLDMEQIGTLGATSLVSDSDYSHSINALSANSGLTYKLGERDSVRATYGRGVQMPSLINTGYSATLKTVTPLVWLDVQGGPDVKPTIVQNYEIGYDRKLPALFSTARLSLYYQTNHDLVGTDPIRPIQVVSGNVLARTQAINLGDSKGWGGEIELTGTHEGLRWGGSYGLSKVTDSPLVKTVLNYANSAPEHHLKANLGYSFDRWELDANALFASSSVMQRFNGSSITALASTDSYYTLGGRIAYNFTEAVTLAASGINITRSETHQSAYPAIERQGLISFTARF